MFGVVLINVGIMPKLPVIGDCMIENTQQF